MTTRTFGLIGLGVMGATLALNLADHGVTLVCHDPAVGAGGRLVAELGDRGRLVDGAAAMAAALPSPRVVFLMVPAGAATDAALDGLLPHLAAGDTVIDGGNAFYKDTARRQNACAARGVRFLGFGVSGGAEGARRGPAIMAGGDAAAVAAVAPVFAAIAARAPDGSPCFARVGDGAAGHFVKTVHNGIEYAHMQLISEAWHLLRRTVGLPHGDVRAIFARWAAGPLSSFLMDCAVRVLDTTDGGAPLIERIVDTAEQKGTGQWTANAALEYGVAAPTLAEAVHARCLSALKEERVAAEAALGRPTIAFAGDTASLVVALQSALEAANITVLAQGFALLRAADSEHHWGVDPAVVAGVWRGGCIIRSTLLEPIAAAFRADPELPNLLRDPALWRRVAAADAAWRQVVVTAVAHGAPVPGFASALSYADAYRTGRLWADMIAAQRDVFGQHGFARSDAAGRHHADWAPLDLAPRAG
ncbi:MAG: NADP-dependent phosphogluconate dehydrogenase [Rhodospirillales bacterium]|nr:NADP-dependent phosphogluconate dehydrogenase [Rhodospirillales bacterium]